MTTFFERTLCYAFWKKEETRSAIWFERTHRGVLSLFDDATSQMLILFQDVSSMSNIFKYLIDFLRLMQKDSHRYEMLVLAVEVKLVQLPGCSGVGDAFSRKAPPPL